MNSVLPPPADALRRRSNSHLQPNRGDDALRSRSNTYVPPNMGDDENCVDLWADVAESRDKRNRREALNQHDPNECQDSDSRVLTALSLPSKSHRYIRSAHKACLGPAIGMTPQERSTYIGTKSDHSNGTRAHVGVSPHPHHRPSRQQQQSQSSRRHRVSQHHQSTDALTMVRGYEDEAKERCISQFELNRGGSFRAHKGQPRRICRTSDPNFSDSENAAWCQQYEEEEQGLQSMRNFDFPHADHRGKMNEEEEAQQGVQRMRGRSPRRAIEGRPRPLMARRGRSMPEQLNYSSCFNSRSQQSRRRLSCSVSTHSRQSTKSAGSRLSSTSTRSRELTKGTGMASSISNRSRESMKSTSCISIRSQQESGLRLPNISTNHSVPEPRSRLSGTPAHSQESINKGRILSSASDRFQESGTRSSSTMSKHSRESRPMLFGMSTRSPREPMNKGGRLSSSTSNLFQESKTRLSSMVSIHDPRESKKRAKLWSISNDRGQESSSRHKNDHSKVARTRLSLLGGMLDYSQESMGGRSSHGNVRKLVLSQECMRSRSSRENDGRKLKLREKDGRKLELKEPRKGLFSFPSKVREDERKEKRFSFRRFKKS